MYSEQWRIEENFRTLKNNISIRPMYVYTDKHIEGHVLLCFATLFVIKMLLLLLKVFYNETGLFGKITEDVLIKVFKELNFVITKDLITNEIIKKRKIRY
ncbi:hypothetical protein RRG40_04000 [Mycoplasmopsis felis]|uniref:hypothetical protein n=1 Tax=Mycoplasmopsis felis TaxID=33923 RepID=UPI002AFE2C78|nr:hypothetical protein [Mycoplasmopsis felis]WQQ05695.1 transposase [Mycoplasmopsis felis]WQQ07282.1 transposase [Mycoplasmopsis felis]